MARHRVNIDLRLIHDGQRWVANNERIAFSGRTLAELGESVKKAVAVTGNHPPGTKVTVCMRFDYNTIPNAAWYRQFMPYYFDYQVSFEIGIETTKERQPGKRCSSTWKLKSCSSAPNQKGAGAPR